MILLERVSLSSRTCLYIDAEVNDVDMSSYPTLISSMHDFLRSFGPKLVEKMPYSYHYHPNKNKPRNQPSYKPFH